MKISNNKFLEIPAISVLNGTIVIVPNEKYETLTIDDKVPDALDLIELITEEYETIYLTDINGLTEGKPQIKLIKELTDFCEIWLEAGSTEAENIYDLFIAGAQEVVLSTKSLDSLMELARAAEVSENIIYEIDYLNKILSPSMQIQEMTPEKLCQELLDIGIDRVIFADLARIGENKSIERNIISSLVGLDIEVYVGGGIKLSDVPLLNKLEANGAIIELTDILQHGKVEL